MIYSDESHDICPFCGKDMSDGEERRECGACRTVIERVESPDGVYYRTDIKHFRKPKKLADSRALEGLYYYRNITEINENGELV